MGSTTFSGPVRVGAKPYHAGTLLAQLAIPSAVALNGTVVATLPPGSLINSVMSDGVSVEIQFDDGTSTVNVTTSATPGDPVYAAAFTSTDPIMLRIVAGVDPSTTYITYKPYDVKSGANG